ncbi:unnamed protein product [Camellia sinensis]
MFYFPFFHLLLYSMGRSEDMISPNSEKACPKSEKASPPKQATIQAYYGPRVPMPPSYLNSVVMACHVPHPHVWAPPQLSCDATLWGASAIYSPGVVYAHPTVPIVATPVSAQMLSTSSDNMNQGSTKKLKRLDGVAMQVVNDNAKLWEIEKREEELVSIAEEVISREAMLDFLDRSQSDFDFEVLSLDFEASLRVGLVCQNYNGLFKRTRRMYFSAADRGEMMSMVYNWPADQVDMIVVTDGSRILGLGDLGLHGIGIAIGKLDLYVAATGINPQRWYEIYSTYIMQITDPIFQMYIYGSRQRPNPLR